MIGFNKLSTLFNNKKIIKIIVIALGIILIMISLYFTLKYLKKQSIEHFGENYIGGPTDPPNMVIYPNSANLTYFVSNGSDILALNNDLINSKYKLTYMQYASIIALGAAIKCICSFSTSYGIYSNIKYGKPKRPSNPGYETVLNQHFQRQLCKQIGRAHV
jgi:hypothetical protein